jgi:hypothetical protein
MGHIEPGHKPPSKWPKIIITIAIVMASVVAIATLVLFGLVYLICSGRR